MKRTSHFILIALGLALLTGCATDSQTAERTLRLGMSRIELKTYYGEPLRVEPDPAGGEDWHYKFLAWKAEATPGEVSTSVANGQVTHYVSGGLQISDDTMERVIHVSPEGFVIEPLPSGKVLRN